MVCHETYKDQNGNWLSPEEVDTNNGKDFFMRKNPKPESESWPFRINVKIKKKYN